jgi:hypothetical protein
MSIDFESLEDQIKSHMGDQPYSVTCSNCGGTLDCASVDIDSDFDLTVKIDPCDTCITNAIEEAKQEMESNNE